jgi:hypothetical protein
MLWAESSSSVKKNSATALDQVIIKNIKYGEIIKFHFAPVTFTFTMFYIP